ncbi:MAG: hypothetical protein DCC75_08735, partial [Proteobacteria bacterium]
MLLRNWLGFWIMVGIALFSLIGFFPGEEETPYVLKEQMESCLILFYIGFAGIFIYWLMPVINERVLLLHTITFQYLIWSLFREYIDKYPAIFAVFAGVPTMAVLVFACTPLQLPGSLRLSAYFWYLAVTSAILAAQVLSSGIEPIYDHGIDSLSSFCL